MIERGLMLDNEVWLLKFDVAKKFAEMSGGGKKEKAKKEPAAKKEQPKKAEPVKTAAEREKEEGGAVEKKPKDPFALLPPAWVDTTGTSPISSLSVSRLPIL